MNRPRASVEPQLATCRKFAPAARNYAATRLQADVGLRVNEVRMLDLDDVRWDLGRFGKLNVRHGKGSSRTCGASPATTWRVARPGTSLWRRGLVKRYPPLFRAPDVVLRQTGRIG